MPQTKLTVKTEFGTFTRKTARPYTHIVIACGREESFLRDQSAKFLSYDKKEQAKYQAVIDDDRFTDEYKQVYRVWSDGLSKQILAAPARLEEKLEENTSKKDARIGVCLSWHSSKALALQGAKTAKLDGYSDVRIVEVGA